MATDQELLEAERRLSLALTVSHEQDEDADQHFGEQVAMLDIIELAPCNSLVAAAVKLRRVLDARIGIATGEHANDHASIRQVYDFIMSIAGASAIERGIARPLVGTEEAEPFFPQWAENFRNEYGREPPTVAPLAANADQPLIEAAARWGTSCAELAALADSAPEEDGEAMYDDLNAADDLLAETPAKSLVGALVKLRVVLDADRGLGRGDILTTDLPILRDVHDVIVRTIKEAGGDVPPLLRPLANSKEHVDEAA